MKDEIAYHTFDVFADLDVVHAVFMRHGGLSPAPWASLNVGGTVGDEPARVIENRKRSFRAVGRDWRTIYDVWQVHGARVVVADRPRRPEEPPLQADAILTDNPQVTLFMRFADCVPILLCDPRRGVVGLAHAGWRGTVGFVAAAAVRRMEQCFGSRPQDVLAAIGPSIGPDHYEIGSDVAAEVQAAFGAQADEVLLRENDALHFDLWRANRLVLRQAGVKTIETAHICTACHLDDWYSHRAERGKTGRFGALIALR